MTTTVAADDIEVSQVKDELEAALGRRYDIGMLLGKGGAGIAFKVTHHASGAPRVAKVLRPSVRELSDLANEFRGEATRLGRLRHPNLVTVFEQAQADETPYFVMDFVDGNSLDAAMPGLVREYPSGRWVVELRKILLQLADALAYLHTQAPTPLLHLDLKPDNIIVTRNYRNRPTPLLLDFGISRFATLESAAESFTIVRGTFPMWPRAYWGALKRMTTPERTVFVIDRQRLNSQLDLHLLGRTLALALEAGRNADPDRSEWSGLEAAEYLFLQDTANRLDIDQQPKHQPFASAAELRKALRRLELRASRTRDNFDEGALKLPGGTVRAFGLRARRLTDWPTFQRLRGIKQLGLTYLVFPGATHTRFEHSLGVFENAIEVLDSLSGPAGDHRFRSVVTDEELVATALVALFHDVGHYPFAHQFRVGGIFPPHEDLTLEILARDEMATRITAVFGKDVYEAMMTLMRYVNAFEHPGKAAETDIAYPVHFRVLRAIVSSTIDVDKLDYVARDSLHAGVPYGTTVDRERFLDSLRVWWDADGAAQLLLSDKGRACAEALVFARYLLTSEVYWNHGVRAYAAMLSAAIAQFGPEEARSHLGNTDEGFLDWLGRDKRSNWFIELVQSRQPYRRAFVHQRLGGSEASMESDRKLFDLLESAAGNNTELRESIMETVAGALNLRPSGEYEIVLDVPAGMTRVRGVQVLAEGHDEPGRVGPIFDAIGENFDGFARKARIFVHPKLMAKRLVAESTAVVRRALIKRFQLE